MQEITSFKELKMAISKNGEMVVDKDYDDNLIIMSIEEYNKNAMKKNIIKKLKQSEKEIENGEGIDSDNAFKELRLKFGY